ncbi:MAG: MerR family transcriptional regulator [Polyangiaceae bacterium]
MTSPNETNASDPAASLGSESGAPASAEAPASAAPSSSPAHSSAPASKNGAARGRRRTARPPEGGMRMAELAMRSGVSRETIHFYLREGLLPRPRKAGRTVAYYDEEHLKRLTLIRKLREEKYLPLAVIRRLLDAPAAAEQDVDTLASVLHLAARDDPSRKLSEAAIEEARRRSLLGARENEGAAGTDPSDRRIVAIVEEALALDGGAREFTLKNLQLVAQDQQAFVMREAELFFETVLENADIAGTIAALRGGRGLVARFIGAYRDLMLRRIVEELLLAIQHGNLAVARSAAVPLSARAEKDLGTVEHRAELRAAAIASATPEAADALVWHLFACGAASEIAALPEGVTARATPRAQVLIAWGAYESARSAQGLRALEQAASATPDFALGQILVGEATMVRGIRRLDQSSGLLERSVPAMHRVVRAEPERDAEPMAQALGCFYRGRVEIAMPAVLGRQRRGVSLLARALALVGEPVEPHQPAEPPPYPIDPACRARIAANARLLLGRYHASLGDPRRAKAILELAASVDPEGPIGEAVREELRRSS